MYMMDYRKYDELVRILEDMNVGFTKISVEVYDDIVFYIVYLDGFDYGDYAGGRTLADEIRGEFGENVVLRLWDDE